MSRTNILISCTFAWLASNSIHGYFLSSSHNSYWIQSNIPTLLKTGLFANESLLCMFWLYLPPLLLNFILHPIKSHAPYAAPLEKLGLSLWLTGSLILYSASWMQFELLGTYMDFSALEMLLQNSWQLITHLKAMIAEQLYSAILFFILGGYAIYTLSSLSFKPGKYWLFLPLGFAASLAMLSCGSKLMIANSSEAYNDEKLGAFENFKAYSNFLRDLKSGPLSYLKYDIINISAGEQLLENIPVTYYSSPLTSTEDYLADIAPNSINQHNVIFFVVESLNSNMLAAYGDQDQHTREINKIAKKSLIAEHLYSQSSHSNYADIALLSSNYPLRSREIHYYPPNPPYPRVMLQDILKPLGYKSAIFSSQNENWCGMINYLDSGNFDTIFHAGTSKKLRPEININKEGDIERAGKVDDGTTIDTALNWLNSIGDNPFYMYLNMQNSHMPYYTPANFEHRFLSKDSPF